MKRLLFVIIAVGSITGCGETKSSSSPNPERDGPTLVADQPKNNSAKAPVKLKKPKRVASHAQPQPTVQSEPPAPVTEAPQQLAAVPVTPVAVEPPKPPKPYVVGIVTQTKSAAQLFDMGTGRAVSDATVCANFGFIPNGSASGLGGSKCFLAYNDGSVQPADYYNRGDANAYVEQLKKQYQTEEQAKKDKKAAKKWKE